MRHLVILFFLAFIASSCETDCEAFDKSREIASWHLFPELNDKYIFKSADESRIFSKIRGEISGFETKKCFNSCNCIRRFSAEYVELVNGLNLQCVVVYDQDGDYISEPISYDLHYFQIDFDVRYTGEIIGMDIDSVLFNPGIEFENLDTLTLGGTLYQQVLHIIMLNEREVSDYWIARGEGLIAFQEDSIQFVRE